MGKIILISGAARSGKSRFAEQLASQIDKQVAYLATAQALDPEMQERINQHQSRRPANWTTFEEPFEIEKIIEENHQLHKTWLLDCLTLFVSNLLLRKIKATSDSTFDSTLADSRVQSCIMDRIDSLCRLVAKTKITLLIVSNEVGWGLVPPDPVSRLYRDIVGLANQKIAARAEEVYVTVLGLPLRIKPATMHNWEKI